MLIGLLLFPLLVFIPLKRLFERKRLRLGLAMLNFLVRLGCVPDIITKPIKTTALADTKKKTMKTPAPPTPTEQHILIIKIVHIDSSSRID